MIKRTITGLIIFSIVLLTCVHQGMSLKCWECRSDQDPKCSDPFDNSTALLKECNQKLFAPGSDTVLCSKVRQKIHGQWSYIRECAYEGKVGIKGDERFCLSRTGSYNLFMEYCTCNSKDGCNVGSAIQTSIISIVFGSIVTGYYYFVQ